MNGVVPFPGPSMGSDDELRLRILIERLVREGYSAQEIVAIVRQAERQRPPEAA